MNDLAKAFDDRMEELRGYVLDEDEGPLNEGSAAHARAFVLSREWRYRPAITCDASGNVAVSTFKGEPRLVARFFADGTVWLLEGRSPVRVTDVGELMKGREVHD